MNLTVATPILGLRKIYFSRVGKKQSSIKFYIPNGLLTDILPHIPK